LAIIGDGLADTGARGCGSDAGHANGLHETTPGGRMLGLTRACCLASVTGGAAGFAVAHGFLQLWGNARRVARWNILFLFICLITVFGCIGNTDTSTP
jgi:hypothetical protein